MQLKLMERKYWRIGASSHSVRIREHCTKHIMKTFFCLFVSKTDRESRYTAFSTRVVCAPRSGFFPFFCQMRCVRIRWNVERTHSSPYCTHHTGADAFISYSLRHFLAEMTQWVEWSGFRDMEDLNRAIADETNETKMRSWARTSVSTKCSTHSSYTPSRSAGVSVSECVARMGKERLILRMRAHCIEHTLAHTRCPLYVPWRMWCDEQFPFSIFFSRLLFSFDTIATNDWTTKIRASFFSLAADASVFFPGDFFFSYSTIPHIASFIPLNFDCLTVKSLAIYFRFFFSFASGSLLFLIRNYYLNANWLYICSAWYATGLIGPSPPVPMFSYSNIAAIFCDNEKHAK